MSENVTDFGGLLRQAHVARSLGSPFVAAVLEAASRQLWRAPYTAQLMAEWTGDPSRAALAMRLNAALHALARRGKWPALAELYRSQGGDFDAAIGHVMCAEDAFIAEWMEHTPQTNEVGRAAAILAALMVLQERAPMPVELLELGSSSGLNLNLTHYAYDLGGVGAGDPLSPVHVAPQWIGRPPVLAPVKVVRARGVDLKPLDPANAATRERLLSFVWADDPERSARLEQALAFARRHPPQVDRADAASWLAARLGEPQEAGVCRVVFHSMVLQYLEAADYDAVMSSIVRGAEAATDERPLAWISFEWLPDRSEVQLQLTSWPGGETRHLATCHPYGQWIHWCHEAGAIGDEADARTSFGDLPNQVAA
jgi:hypothetical protein